MGVGENKMREIGGKEKVNCEEEHCCSMTANMSVKEQNRLSINNRTSARNQRSSFPIAGAIVPKQP